MKRKDKRYVEHTKIPIDFVDKDKNPQRKYVAISKRRRKDPPPAPTLDYHPQEVPGVCLRCKTVSTVVFPGIFSYNIGDAIMDRKTIDCVCLVCGGDSKFLPIDFSNANEKSFRMIEEMHKRLLREEAGLK